MSGDGNGNAWNAFWFHVKLLKRLSKEVPLIRCLTMVTVMVTFIAFWFHDKIESYQTNPYNKMRCNGNGNSLSRFLIYIW